MSFRFYETIWRNIPDDSHFQEVNQSFTFKQVLEYLQQCTCWKRPNFSLANKTFTMTTHHPIKRKRNLLSYNQAGRAGIGG
jgi:hypothetical protein